MQSRVWQAGALLQSATRGVACVGRARGERAHDVRTGSPQGSGDDGVQGRGFPTCRCGSVITTFLLPTRMRPGRGSSLFSDSQVALYGMLPPYGSNYALFMIAPSIATWLCCVRVSTRFSLNSQMDTVSRLPSVPLPPATFFLCRNIESGVSLQRRSASPHHGGRPHTVLPLAMPGKVAAWN